MTNGRAEPEAVCRYSERQGTFIATAVVAFLAGQTALGLFADVCQDTTVNVENVTVYKVRSIRC